jgi:hypothetical protein
VGESTLGRVLDGLGVGHMGGSASRLVCVPL